MNSSRPDYERDVAYFDRWAKSYERSLSQRFFFGPIQKKVLDVAGSLPESSTILDVGCGTGRLLRAAAERWPRAQLIGVDPAAGMLEVARELNPKATFHVATSDAIPLPDGSVSVAFTTLSFHHWSDQSGGIREVRRVLRTGGCFILADISLPAGISRLVRNLHRTSPTPEQGRLTLEFLRLAQTGEKVLQGIFEQAGFTVSSQFRVMFGFVLVIKGIKER
jgi:ubiquinone/menaquinone biosynthesis C-methylase UbiE